MNTEKPQLSNSRTRAGKIPVSRKLQFVVVVFAGVFFALLGLVYFSSGFSSAARAYVQGEGTWSKAQKEATIRLQEYAASRDEKDYQAFLDCLSVQLGDRIAREELEKPQPNYTAIYAGFQQGKIAEADIPGMITLFRNLRKTKEIAAAVSAIARSDRGKIGEQTGGRRFNAPDRRDRREADSSGKRFFDRAVCGRAAWNDC